MRVLPGVGYGHPIPIRQRTEVLRAGDGYSFLYRAMLAVRRISDLEGGMSSLAILAGVLFAIGIVLSFGVITVAVGRQPDTGLLSFADITQMRSSTKRSSTKAIARSSSTGTALAEPPTDPELKREPVTENQYGVTRRRFFGRATSAVFGLVVAQFALVSLAFIWPKLKAGFGIIFNAGNFNDLRAEVLRAGTVMPKFFPQAQAYVIPMKLDAIPGSSYEKLPYIVTGGEDNGIGLMALWMRCPHLGCRVPVCMPSQGFECPCHGSRFSMTGEYYAGPSPRNMDRFAVSTNDAGELIIDTGTIVQTARSKVYTAEYPQGPLCV